MCMKKFQCVLDKDTLHECQVFINREREARHLKVLERKKSKFNRLWLWLGSKWGSCSNIHSTQDHSGTFSGHSNPNYIANIKATTTTAKTTIATITMAATSTSPGTSPDNIMAKLVIILSSSLLTKAHNSLLAKILTFAIMPRYSPKGHCREVSLTSPKAAEHRTETSCLLRGDCLQPNIMRDEARALKVLRYDQSRVIFTVNKWVATVVLD